LLDSATETARPNDLQKVSIRTAVGNSRAGLRIRETLAAISFARVFTQPVRFAAREIGGEAAVRSYVVRESSVRIHLRHGTADSEVVRELFVERVYEPPGPVVRLLAELERPPRILDLGANIGLFGAFALGRWPGARIVAVEPDPSNLEIHRLTVAANPTADWHLEGAAAANREGRLPFAAGRFGASAVIEGQGSGSEPAQTVPAIDALPLMANADLIKIDIEGSEWALLEDARFGEVQPAALVLEHHAHLCPGPEPRSAAREAIAAAGYETVEARLPPGACPGQGMLWAWRPSA